MSIGRRFTQMFGVQLPIIQAPMAGCSDAELAVAVAEAGGLGSLPCALLDVDQVRAAYADFRRQTSRPINLNFFCHAAPSANATHEAAWRNRLQRYYQE